jgi:hypothetical protein
MTHWIYGQGQPPGDEYGLLYSVDLEGRTVVARPGDREFVLPSVMLERDRDEIAARQAHSDQVLAEWIASVDEANDEEDG